MGDGTMNKINATIKRVLLTVALLGVVTMFMGCHTAHGFGQDVEKTGEKIQEKTQ
jgi:predicted small secreted protein